MGGYRGGGQRTALNIQQYWLHPRPLLSLSLSFSNCRGWGIVTSSHIRRVGGGGAACSGDSRPTKRSGCLPGGNFQAVGSYSGRVARQCRDTTAICWPSWAFFQSAVFWPGGGDGGGWGLKGNLCRRRKIHKFETEFVLYVL